jgi:hypothetical protein
MSRIARCGALLAALVALGVVGEALASPDHKKVA